MLHLLVKKPLCNRADFCFISSFRRLLSSPLPSTESPSANPPAKSNFAFEYLVESCGLPTERATAASKYISHFTSYRKPDSILQFLRESGLSYSDIRKSVGSDPQLLCANLENIVKPRIRDAQEAGFSPSQIAQLISIAPSTFRSRSGGSLQENIKFWMPFFGSFERMLSVLKTARFLLSVSVEKVVEPNISFLEKHCGMSQSHIRKILTTAPVVLTLKTNTLASKIKNLKNVGFSNEEIETIIKKQALTLTNSDERIRKSIDFLTREAGFDLPYIALHPVLISLSVERRIMPRHYVLKTLRSKGLCEKFNFYSAMCITEKSFEDKFVKPYKDKIPEAIEAYEAALAVKALHKGRL